MPQQTERVIFVSFLIWTTSIHLGLWTRSLQSDTYDVLVTSVPSKIAFRSQTKENSCLSHDPLVLSPERVPISSNGTKTTLILSQPAVCGQLRRNWTAQSTFSTVTAKQIEEHQSNCALPVRTYHLDNQFGLGSHLYLWSQAVCNAQEAGYRISIYNNPDWLWRDQIHCPDNAALACYFKTSEPGCQPNQVARNVTSDPRDKRHRCKAIKEGSDDFLREYRAASMEFLFRGITPLVIREAQRQVGLLFDGGTAPDDLITIHIRWGDKFWEMDLVPIEEYIAAVHEILLRRDPLLTTVNIYLACEDPKAVQAFLAAAPSDWKVYVDRTITELDDFRPKRGNRASWTTRNTKGRAGLVALGSLLVALEAKYFVLTTASNWSRIMDDLRKTIIDPNCGNCTSMIDLRPGLW